MNDEARAIVIRKSNITFNGNGHTINLQAATQTNANAFGVVLEDVYNVIVANTTIINTGNGIYAIQNPTAGIGIFLGGSNLVVNNNIVNNYNSMSLRETTNNLIIRNNFTNNNNPLVIVSSVMLWGSSNNTIYQNNFVNNNRPAGIGDFSPTKSLGNMWDNGKEGNYWDDYNGTDEDGNGIGDSRYEIYYTHRGGPIDSDRYSLMAPFNSTFYFLRTAPPRISFISPLKQTYNESSLPLIFTFDKAFSWVAYSLDGKNNETITTNTTLSELPNGNHKITIFAQDAFGNFGNQTIDFTITVLARSQPFPAIPIVISILAIIGSIVGLLLFRRQHVKSKPNT